MSIGIGGSTAAKELKKITDMTLDVQPIKKDEYVARIEKARNLIKENNFEAVYLNAGTNLYYFTGTQWSVSERMGGAILSADGTLHYISPGFEKGTMRNFMLLQGEINTWEEHENPYVLFGQILKNSGIKSGKIGLDETSSYFLTNGIAKANPSYTFENAKPVLAGCRMCKSDNEIAIIQAAKNITMTVIRAAAKILYPGIPAQDVVDFINNAHIKAGASAGSFFCIVLFADDTQFPHGVPSPQPLRNNDVVLLDTGCQLHGYISDITRTFIYGKPSARHKEIWDLEKATQRAAFEAAQIGATCASVDIAGRKVIEKAGLGPDYKIPGLPHRVGHGTGLDIHEYPFFVRNDMTLLQKGMVISNEPMICIPGEFGIRHEDHIYMSDSGPKWFTQPMKSIDDPFGLG